MAHCLTLTLRPFDNERAVFGHEFNDPMEVAPSHGSGWSVPSPNQNHRDIYKPRVWGGRATSSVQTNESWGGRATSSVPRKGHGAGQPLRRFQTKNEPCPTGRARLDRQTKHETSVPRGVLCSIHEARVFFDDLFPVPRGVLCPTGRAKTTSLLSPFSPVPKTNGRNLRRALTIVMGGLFLGGRHRERDLLEPFP